ncbi:MAG: tetratricopeptide repeat protein [Vicingus serpentipes]|nr:tetratricopeptide repeat protein [Vicingus serpentipes]
MRILTRIGLLLIIFFTACQTDTKPVKEVEEQVAAPTEKTLAFQQINDQLKADINNPSLYLKRAQLYKQYNDLSSAVDDVDRAIKIDSLIPEFYLLKAELLKTQNKLKEAKATLDKCMLIDNGNIPARLELGFLALVVKDYKQALNYADAVLKRDLYSAEAYHLKGMIFEEQGDTALAISSFITAVEQESNYYDAYIHLGLLHMNSDKILAKGYLKNALKLQPNSLDALYAYALCCQEKGDYNEAIETYHNLLTIKEISEAYFNLGYIHQEYLKTYDVAIDNYTKAIAIAPNYYEAYYNRGLCYEELKKYQLAEKDFRMSLKINPTYTYSAIALERVSESK